MAAYVGGEEPARLTGTVALMPPSEQNNGAMLFADARNLTELDFGSPFSRFPRTLDAGFSSPPALAADERASFAAQQNGTVRKIPVFFGPDSVPPATLSSVDLKHRRIVRIAHEAQGLWVLAVHDGTATGLPSRPFLLPISRHGRHAQRRGQPA